MEDVTMCCDAKVKHIMMIPLDSLQIYFNSSLELQQELISHGFYVPKSPDGSISMPLPIIYSNFRGWLVPREPITIEKLILPEWLGLTPLQLNWKEVKVKGKSKRGFEIPEEEIYVNIGVDDGSVVFDIDVRGYHLERASIRQVNPEKWTNWMMFYIDLNYLSNLINTLCSNFVKTLFKALPKVESERLQGGKEVTYYVPIEVKDYSFCLGCFDLALLYLKRKAEEHCRYYPSKPFCRDIESGVKGLRLRLTYSRNIEAFAKVGIAKIKGKRPQIMVKVASTGPTIKIKGILKEEVEGKARGSLIHCTHEERRQYVVLDIGKFCNALMAVKGYINKLPRE
jgi:hypothetical protein